MKPIKLLGIALGLMAFAVIPGESSDDGAKLTFSASRTDTFSAQVTAINHETREVTLTGSNGESATFTASDAVRNLAQVQAGDLVVAEIYEEINASVYPNPDQLEPGVGEIAGVAAAELGQMPGAVAQDTMVVTAVVEAIDLEANTYTLRGPDGSVKTFEAMDPENLKKGAVGDLVVFSVTQAMGILVEHPGAE